MPGTPRAYLDHASDTPLLDEARAAMAEWLAQAGDPGRIHREGALARHALEEARDSVAALAGARPRDVVFTSSATEALNWAVDSLGRACRKLVVSQVEHSAVIEPALRLAEERAAGVDLVPVDETGRIDTEALATAVDGAGGEAAVFVQHANHEIGTVQDLETVAEICRSARATLVVDAAQSAGKIPAGLEATGASVLVMSAHKMGGPQGIGALVLGRGVRLRPLLVGGSQERARRAGAENVPAAVGFGAAARSVAEDLPAEEERLRRLRQVLVESALAAIHGLELLGHPAECLPHIAAFRLPDVQGEAVLLALDRAGVAAHSGSACSSEGLAPSHILEAIGADSRLNIRFSLGRSTTEQEVKTAVGALAEAVGRLVALQEQPG